MYYTYAHYSPEGQLFYIGKGSKDRAFSFGGRHQDWKRAVKFFKGVKVQILAEWQTETEVFEHEKILIECFKDLGYALVNKTKGGKGAFGVVKSQAHKDYLKDKLTGYTHKQITCPNCKMSGGQTSMKRWHFDKCTGVRPFKSRVTVNGKRVYLGYFATKEEADKVASEYKKSQNEPT
jgi:hypothetical protein